MMMPLVMEPTLRIQVNQIDHCMIQTGPLDSKSPHPFVPVIRIFGTSSIGKGACVYVHQVYPYFFVEYKGNLDPPHVKQYIHTLKRSLNSAIALHLRKDPCSPRSNYVRAVILVKGIHFYGFHSSYSPFLKILLANPMHTHRAVSVMQSGTVMQTRFQVFESHLSYILQFMCDFNLYGCGWIELGEIWCRQAQGDETDEATFNYLQATRGHTSFRLSPYHRLSRTSLEVDVIAPQILNRFRIKPRNLHHSLEIPGLKRPNEPLILSLRELWDDERNRRQSRGLPPSPELPVDPTEHSRSPGGHWTSVVRFWDELEGKIDAERTALPAVEPNRQWENLVMTSFESLEALWDKQWRVWAPDKHHASDTLDDRFSIAADPPWDEHNPESNNNTGEIDIDESFLPVDNFDEDDEELQTDEELENLMEADEAQLLEEGPEETAYDQDLDEDDICIVKDPEDVNPFLETTSNSQQGATARSDDIKTEVSCLNGSLRYREASSLPKDLGLLHAQRVEIECCAPVAKPSTDVQESNPADLPTPALITPRLSLETRQVIKTQSPAEKSKCQPPAVAQTLRVSIQIPPLKAGKANGFVYAKVPPTVSEILRTSKPTGVASTMYRNPFYSKVDDAPPKAREYAGLMYRLKGGHGLDTLEPWDEEISSWIPNLAVSSKVLCASGIAGWEYAGYPPSRARIKNWLSRIVNAPTTNRAIECRSQIEGPTQTNLYGLQSSLAVPTDGTVREQQQMLILGLEVFAKSADDKIADPERDEIVAAFYVWQRGVSSLDSSLRQRGVIIVDGPQAQEMKLKDVKVDIVSDELELLNSLIDMVLDLDPDILTGWEVQRASWGFLIARGCHYGYNIEEVISRASLERIPGSEVYNFRHTSTLKVAGRHVLNLWRVMRGDMTLNMYTFENVVFHVLRKRVPRYSPETLTTWYTSEALREAARVIYYFLERTGLLLELLDVSELITKTGEFARVFGVDFFSVISRGSQFKVESFMARLAKPESFILLSPSKADVGKQNAAECMPLIMEPASAFYSSPLLVLDFQSLYPSLMIAYNYCYSTCLGRVRDFQGQNKFGVTVLDHPPGLLDTLHDHIQIAPNGIMYVKRHVREGLLGRMQTELLDTRVMIKQAMKRVKEDKVLRRILDARQLGLKYILNVTYGYTSASFSGRMPAVEIADSIVQSARETLENVGDSSHRIYVKVGRKGRIWRHGHYLQGKLKDEAFRIGHEIADTITALNPSPIKLKFEKVYFPCVLLAKKRYVGFKYESPDDVTPVFEAKGIETVRRDGVPAQRKMTEICLKKLFRSQDLSDIKKYCCQSWTQILEDKVSIQDFIFAKEVKLGTYSDRVPPPPGVAVAARRLLADPNDEPQYGERIPYVVTRGEPGSRLIERAAPPLEVLIDSDLHLDADYYISRVLIPPLERIFNLVGADVRSWYDEMPKPPKAVHSDAMSPSKQDSGVNIDGHMQNSQCLICGDLAWNGVCGECIDQPQTSIAGLQNLLHKGEQQLMDVHRICSACTGSAALDTIECESIDCPWLFERKKAERRGEFLEVLQLLIQELDSGIEDEDLSMLDHDDYENLRIEYI